MKKQLFLTLMVLAVSAGLLSAEVVRVVTIEGKEIVASYKDGETVVAKEVFNESGTVLSREGTIPDGVVHQYATNGTVLGEWPYLGGKKNGIVKRYTERGKLKLEASFKDSRRDGISREYAPDGKVTLEETYRNGRRDGVTKVYLRDGTLFSEIRYKADKKDGIARTYYANGRLGEETEYRQGVRDGVSTTYFAEGTPPRPEHVLTYRNGTLVKRVTYAPDGNVVAQQDLAAAPVTTPQ